MIKISSNKELFDLKMIHQFLTNTYWATGRTLAEVEKSIKHCHCFGVFYDEKQIGFARVCTDYVVFAYLMDVFILPTYQGNGYAKLLMQTIIDDPKLKNIKTWLLQTSDAHDLYKQFGFKNIEHPEKMMRLTK